MTPELPGYAHVYSGKVRDLYTPADAGEAVCDRRVLVAEDIDAEVAVAADDGEGRGAAVDVDDHRWRLHRQRSG